MGQFIVKITEKAEKDLTKHKKSGNRTANKKIIKILKELSVHPKTGTGNPEQLKYELSGFWSRRITQKDRMIYEIQEKVVTVKIVSAMGHYKSK